MTVTAVNRDDDKQRAATATVRICLLETEKILVESTIFVFGK